MAYVPPALRKKQEAVSDGSKTDYQGRTPILHDVKSSDGALPTVDDIQDHFWPQEDHNDHDGLLSSRPDNPEDGETLENKTPIVSAHKHSTLNGTAKEPNKLRYLLLFKGANPKWTAGKIVFAKTHLELLPKPEASLPSAESADQVDSSTDQSVAKTSSQPQASPTTKSQEATTQPDDSETSSQPLTDPIMVFEQQQGRSHDSGFTFIGYHHLTKLEILEPHSAGLVRMLDQKWAITNTRGSSRQRQRDPTKWQESLNQRWAVLKFEKDDEADTQSPAPKIAVKERSMMTTGTRGQEGSRKGVNDMLKEMRLKDSSKEESKDNGKETEGS